MSKNLQKILLALAAVSSTVCATEIRTPWLTENGPLRYTFEKLHEDKCNINLWSAAHVKEAHKAFMKSGTKSQPLTALIFNQSDFTIGQAFPSLASAVPPLPAGTTEMGFVNFNPFIQAKSISPRVAYTEYGMDFGARWDCPVWSNKGRIGLRATVPFRRIEMERLDSELDESEVPSGDFVDSKQILVNLNNAGVSGVANQATVEVTAYRLDLLTSLGLLVPGPLVVPAQLGMTSFGSQLGANVTGAAGNVRLSPTALTVTNPATGKPYVDAFQFSDGLNTVPGVDGPTNPATSTFVVGSFAIQSPDYTTNAPTANTLTVFDNNLASNYAAAFGNAAYNTFAAKTWLTFRRQTDSPDVQRFGAGVAAQSGAGGLVARQIDALLATYNENAFTYLNNQNFSLDSVVRSGIGDIDLDLFYEHTFNADWMGELMVGVRFPTGGTNNEYGNPYNTVQLGNGNHWEVKIGGELAFQPWHCMNFKVDAKYSFVIEAVEHRIAAFQGATIKNFGPRADADVDWGYFVGHFDMNFFHPKTSDIRGTLGYEFYYKVKDHVSYKQAAVSSFRGALLTGTAAPFALSNSLAEENTESMGHKVRGEVSAQILKYFEIFAGGAWTFAGQHVMADKDAHGGFNVRF